MSRKLYPGEARKVRAMLEMGYTDVEISRALHVAQSTISNMRNEEQNDVVETESEPPHESEIEPSQESEELTEEEETDLQIYEMIHSGYTDSEIAQEVGVSEDFVRNHREPETINFVGGTPPTSEEPEKNESESERSTGTITYVGGRKHKEPEEEDFDWECGGCGHEFNGNPSNCPECGMEFEWDGNSENKGSLDLGKIIAGLGGLATVGLLIHQARNNNQNWSESSWNNQGTPWINRFFNNQNQLI